MPFDTREMMARLLKCEAGGEGNHMKEHKCKTVKNRVDEI